MKRKLLGLSLITAGLLLGTAVGCDDLDDISVYVRGPADAYYYDPGYSTVYIEESYYEPGYFYDGWLGGWW